MQGDNVTDELRPFIEAGTKLDFSYETNGVIGGPIKRDKLWFLVAQRIYADQQPRSAADAPTFPKGGECRRSGGQ